MVRPGDSPSQNGIGGVGALGVDHPHHAGLDPADAPGVGAEQEHVAGHRLDGPVLVDGADQGVVGVGEDPVVGQLGDGAAAGQRGEPGTARGPDLAVDPVVVEVRRARRPRPVAMPSLMKASVRSKSARLSPA